MSYYKVIDIPKYLDPQIIIPKMAENLKGFVDMEEREVTKYMCKLFDGILDDSTIRNKLNKEYKSR